VPIEIRSATYADAEAIQRIYEPFVLDTAISFEDLPPSVDEIAGRIASTLKTHPWLVAVVGGKVCGYVYASAHRERAAYRYSADTTVYIAPEAQRRGVGQALYAELLPQLKQRNIHMAFAGIALPNLGSVALHESMGFVPVGVYREVGFKFGRWHDVGWWQRILSATHGLARQAVVIGELDHRVGQKRQRPAFARTVAAAIGTQRLRDMII
jgi:phosphinothricin acetyltransferase